MEVVPTGEGIMPGLDEREAREGVQLMGESRSEEEGKKARAELFLVIVPAEQPSQGERPSQAG